MTPDPFELKVVTYKDYQSDIQYIRTQVFIIEQGIPESLEWDSYEHSSWHVLAFSGSQAVATGRLQPDGKITRIAVLKPWRQMGLANQILVTLLQLAADYGLESLYLNAQTSATGLYKKHGFTSDGEVFDEGGIEHIRMQRL